MKSSIQHILALVPNWIGDVAMCTPALRALARCYPEAELTVAGRAPACALLAGLPWIQRFEAIPARPGMLEAIRHGRRLKPHARDLCVIFPHSFRSAVLAWFSGARQRVGYDRDGRRALLTAPVPPYRENGQIAPIYMAREYLDLVAALGCADDGKGLELAVDPAVQEAMRARLAGHGPIVGFSPGGAFGPSKRWPAERFARVADLLTAKAGARCVLLTGPGEERICDDLLSHARTRFLPWYDGAPSLELLKAAIAQLTLLVCNDSGPRHIAVAFKVPAVCIMGSTSPRYSEGAYERGTVVRVDVDCGPCQKPECETDHRCMLRIEPEMVARAALIFLNESRRPANLEPPVS